MKTIGLYSKRWTVARGWVWIKERDCETSTAQVWLEVFQRDEPTIQFTLTNKPPKN